MQPKTWVTDESKETDFVFGEDFASKIPDPKFDKYAPAFARCFSSHDGQIVLEYLVLNTHGYTPSPEASEAALRAQLGQRALVDTIIHLAEIGREPNNPRSFREVLSKIVLKIRGVTKP